MVLSTTLPLSPASLILVLCFTFCCQPKTVAAQKTKLVKERGIERISRKSDTVVGVTHIVIDKSDGFLRLYDDAGLRARYPAVFGSEPDRDKFREGDKRTPEGLFTIVSIRKHEKWHLMLLLDYPTEESRKTFERRKLEGKMDANASIGGAIGIHGTWPHEEYMIDKRRHWTDGCISLKNNHIDDLKKYIRAGTKVEIQK